MRKEGAKEKQKRTGKVRQEGAPAAPPAHLVLCLYAQIHTCPVRSNLCSCRPIFEVAGKDC